MNGECLLGKVRGIALEPTYFDLKNHEVDATAIVAEAKAAGANAVRLGALSHDGCAYYPSDVAPQAPGLGDRDLVGDFTSACQQAGVELVIYTNSKFVIGGAFEEHPEWAERSGGRPATWEGPRPLTAMCHETPYFDRYLDVLREIMRRYAPRTMYIDCFGVRMNCECDWCGARYREAHGFDPPTTVDLNDPRWRGYLEWNIERNKARAREIVSAIREGQPDTNVVFNRGAWWTLGATSPENLAAFAHEIADNIHTESAVRFYGEEFEHIDEQCMIGDAINTPIWVWVEYSAFPWSHLACPPAELRVKAGRVFAHGARPMLWCLPSAPDADRGGLDSVGDVYRLARDHERHFDGTQSLAPVAILVSSSTMREYGRAPDQTPGPNTMEVAPGHVQEVKGFVAALRRSRVPARFILDGTLEAGDLEGTELLVLANAACLSERQCERIRRFAAGGGTVLATYETSLCDEAGTRRNNFALADLFGADHVSVGPRLSEREGWAGKMIASYVLVDSPDAVPCDWQQGFRFPAGGESVVVSARPGAKVLGRLLTPTRYYCDFPGAPTPSPGIVVNDFGAGRCVYVSWQMGALYLERGFAEHRQLVEAVARAAAGGALDIECDLPATATLTVRRARNGDVVLHVLNLSADPRAGVEEVVPLRGRALSVSEARFGAVRSVRALVAAEELPVRRADGRAIIALPDLYEYEVVVLGVGPGGD